MNSGISRTSRTVVRTSPVAVAIALALGANGVTFATGMSPLAVSLLGAATTIMGWWAFVSEP